MHRRHNSWWSSELGNQLIERIWFADVYIPVFQPDRQYICSSIWSFPEFSAHVPKWSYAWPRYTCQSELSRSGPNVLPNAHIDVSPIPWPSASLSRRCRGRAHRSRLGSPAQALRLSWSSSLTAASPDSSHARANVGDYDLLTHQSLLVSRGMCSTALCVRRHCRWYIWYVVYVGIRVDLSSLCSSRYLLRRMAHAMSHSQPAALLWHEAHESRSDQAPSEFFDRIAFSRASLLRAQQL